MITGLRAESTIAHGGAVHEIMGRHQTLAISVTVVFALLTAWRIWRRHGFGPAEGPAFLAVAAVGAGLLIYVASLGGTMVFRHAGGIPTPVLEDALAGRAAGHEHAPGEEHGDHDQGAAVDSAGTGGQASDEAGSHSHAPGTPAHDH